MKKLLITAMAVLLGAATLWARPALKGALAVKQPDGTTVTIRLHGDEHLHFNTTDDGYSIVRNDQGFYVYAQKQNGQLVPTRLVAHDTQERTAEEVSFLKSTAKYLAPDMSSQTQETMKRLQADRARTLAQRKADLYNYSQFKGLVILVQYNDCQFKYSDFNEIMQHMINDENYTGDSRTNIPRDNYFVAKNITCTGSMRDYFRDNSNGVFNPTFDVVGPVNVNRSQYYVNGNDNAEQLMIDACTAADSQVNFKDYDTDNDGKVDMIYFIFAGLPSYIQGNDSRLLWPHQYDISYRRNVTKDGVRLGRYACSTELFGMQSYNWSVLEGIGTMCHEFSHVLGLPDFYDTNNMDQNDCVCPDNWSVMANGADFNYGRTPCGYSLFERYALGFTMPQVIKETGTFTLDNLSQSNAGYRLNTPVSKEYFMLENRQKTKWDAELPGHGMLIFRVDSTNTQVWTYYNSVNDYANHPYYELLRAGGLKYEDGYRTGADSDPFPGTNRVTTINNETTPNLKTWTGRNNTLGLRNITEQGGKITFETYDVNVLTEIVLAENAVIGVGTTLQLVTQLVPETAISTFTWTSDNQSVATVNSSGLVTGVAEGTARITVTAANGVSATCIVTVKNLPIMDNIAAFCQMEEGSEAMLQLPAAQVLYVKNNNAYIRDASGCLLLSQTGISLKRNDMLSGMIYGKLVKLNRMPALVGVDEMTNDQSLNIVAGSAPEPRELHMSQLGEQHYSDLVTIKKAQLVRDGGVWATFGDKRVRLYNTLGITSPKITVPTDMTKRYDILAIYGTNTLNGEVIDEFYLLQSPTAATYTGLTAISLPESMQTEAGRTLQVQPVLTPTNADAWLSYSSSNEQVATVSADGLLTTLANGTTTITVTDAETGLQAECQLLVGDRMVVTDIAAFKALNEGIEADLTLNNAQVLYVHGSNIYVHDASGALILSGTGLSATRNQLLNGKLFGIRIIDNGMPVLKGVSGVTTPSTVALSDGSEAVPVSVLTNQLGDNLLCDYVVVKSAQLERNNGIWAVNGDERIRLYNTFGVSGIKVPTTVDGKYYDITAIYGTNLLNGEIIYELKLLKSPEETTAPSGIQLATANGSATPVYYDLNGRRLSTAPVHGVYVVRQNGQVVKKAQ